MRYFLFALLHAISLFTCCQPAARFDVVIDEIFPDPSPPVQLPNAEFIELKNVSGRSISLAGWRLNTATATSGAFPAYNLPADSFLIITSTTNASLFIPFGRVLGVPSFPSLDNDGSVLSVFSKEGVMIHAISYEKNWFNNDLKREGGWTLEMIDTRNPCTGSSNWRESRQSSGGTPGRKNSVDDVNHDDEPPSLERSYTSDSITVIAVFNEPLDSISAADVSAYTVDGPLIINAKPLPPLFDKVQLKLSQPLSKQKVYELKVRNVKDCAGNMVGIYNKAKTGVDDAPKAKDIVVNEILFNPLSAGADFVEIYNFSKGIFNLGKIHIANRTSMGALGSLKKLREEDYFFYPGEYIVVTIDAAALKKQYFVKDPNAIIELSSMPTFPDDEGVVVVVNAIGEVVDEVSYSEKWHFPLIADAEGVSLEKRNFNGSSSSVNWHSASATSGFATPGYINSQYQDDIHSGATVSFSTKIISPDNDGWQDYLTIYYKMDRPGFVANVRVYSAAGILVKEIGNNALLGIEGKFTWDGLNEKQQILSPGIYVVHTALFRVDGKKVNFKNMIVVAGRK
jgi:Lamin Tail Domain